MPLPSLFSIPARRRIRRLGGLAGLVLVVVGLVPGARARAADAVVVHQLGYQATVAGWTSWYGSYAMGAIGPAWCIDHGIAAPDPAYGYTPTTVADHDPATTRAMAWALGRYGPEADRPTAAALTLVLHDLAGAVYPQGRIDVDRMTVGGLAGFAGDEAAVLSRARQIKADAVAHAVLIPPLRATATRDPGGPDVVVRLTDRDGRPVAGATLDGAAPGGRETDVTGRGRIPIPPPATGPVAVDVTVPDLTLAAWAPTRAAAQRVARPGRTHLRVTLPALPPAPTTTTTAPTTTPPRPAPVVAAAVTPVAVQAPSAPARPELPFTGAPIRSLGLIGAGVALMGVAALLAS